MYSLLHDPRFVFRPQSMHHIFAILRRAIIKLGVHQPGMPERSEDLTDRDPAHMMVC